MSQNNYTVDSIKALTDREHVRLKPSMYIGDTLQHGINQLVYEIIDNSIDEFLAGFGNKINVHIYKDCSVRVQDFGRGVPVGLTKDANGIEINSITLIFSKLMSGGKYQQDENGNNPYQYSAGQFGIGSGCCNFCSEFFEVTVSRDGKIWRQRFERGIPVTEVEAIGVTDNDDTGKEITGTEIYYKPDKEIFKQTLKPSNDVRNRLQELAALNSGLTINFINDLSNIKETFYYDNGITSYLTEIVKSKKLLFDTPIYINGDFGTGKNVIKCEFAFIVDNEVESSSTIRSFTNNINTYTGGTHVNATKLALRNVLNAVGIKNKLFKDDLDIKYYLDGLYLIINLKMSNPSFEGQTKIKLNSVEVEPAITAVINDFFKKKLKDDEFKHIIDKILNHAIQVKEADEAARKARLEKRITNKVTKKSLLPVQLSDCINAGTDEYSELLLVEGQSAAGCVISSTFIHLADNRDIEMKIIIFVLDQ